MEHESALTVSSYSRQLKKKRKWSTTSAKRGTDLFHDSLSRHLAHFASSSAPWSDGLTVTGGYWER